MKVPRVSLIHISLFIVAAFYLVTLIAGFVAPYGFMTVDRGHTNCPPTALHFVDGEGRFHIRPFVFLYEDVPGETEKYAEDRTRQYPVQFFTRESHYRLAGLFPSQIHLLGVSEPARIYLFGTDEYGRDQFSRFLYGAQVSLLVGTFAAALALLIGLSVAALCGVYGGWVDSTVMRFAELFMALPWLYLLFAARAILPLRTSPGESLIIMLSIVALVGWAKAARLFRGVILSAREQGFVTAARTIGGSDWYVFRRHILPQTQTIFLTQTALLIPQFIVAEVTLSFLGLGIGEPVPSWGSLIANLSHYDSIALHWWLALPVFAVVPLFFSYYEIATALQNRNVSTMI